MDAAVAESATGWSSERPRLGKRARLRDALAPVCATLVLMSSHFLFGAVQPISALSLSAAIAVFGVIAVLIGGPRHVTLGMVVGAVAIWVFAVTGWAGPLDQAGPTLAALFAAGAMWTMGYVAARQRGTLDAVWTGLVWTSLIYCVWFFFAHLAAQSAGPSPEPVSAGFAAPASASILFSLFMLVGAARILHVVKHVNAEGAPKGGELLDRMLREGLGGALLFGFSVICLLLELTLVGVLIASAVLIFYAWWDTRGVVGEEPGAAVATMRWLAPKAAFALAVWGVALCYMSFNGGAGASTASHLGRLEAYFNAFRQAPVFGHGLGSIASVGDQATTLYNADAMLAPGGAQNVFVHWLVEAGVVGAGVVFLLVIAMHARILRAFGSRRIPRTFLRLAFAASGLMLLHGVADSSLDLPGAVWFYALVLGGACGVASLARRQKTKIKPV